MDSEGEQKRVIHTPEGTFSIGRAAPAITINRKSGPEFPILFASFVAVAASVVGAIGSDLEKANISPTVLWIVGAVAVAAFVGVAVPYFFARRRYLQNENMRFADIMKHQKEYEKEALDKLKKSTELATLMELNQGQIKDYHTIVTNQADKSFRSSQTAMAIGIAMLVGCLISGFYVDAAQLRWFVAAVAAISSTMAAFLNRTYLSMYRDSIAQLNRYFDQPVLNSYYLTAERLSESLGPEAQHEVRRHIIVEVLKTSASMSDKRRDTEESAPEEPKIPKQKKRKQKDPA
ncbi:TRADD-N-associated membrane domain-containing protein [Streptomyces sp. MMBL 11-1]|uniref:TRADD-N-associated membrane domain-containing protein n=1 Tax=Streptomyces sp. MMBL 11-1 TaxID=3026420 RepID=UPI002363184C|nr:hypothetical protein [Streptomyces sp. MMBL 11-1]